MTYQFDDISVDLQRVVITRNRVPVEVEPKAFDVLRYLLEHADRMVSKEELLNAVWGAGTDSTDRTVDTHIKTLRAKLQELAPEHDYIVTHRGMGYSLDIARGKGD